MFLYKKIGFFFSYNNIFLQSRYEVMRSLFWVLQSTSFENGGGLDEAVGYIFWTINDYSILLPSLFRGEPRQVCLFSCFFFSFFNFFVIMQSYLLLKKKIMQLYL